MRKSASPPHMNNEQLWQGVLAELEISLTKANFSTWLRHTGLLRVEGDKAIIGVPSHFIQQWIEKKYHNAIVTTLAQLTKGDIKEASYEISSKIAQNPVPATSNILVGAVVPTPKFPELSILATSTGPVPVLVRKDK